MSKDDTLSDLKLAYEDKKAQAVAERAELEELRTVFSNKCTVVSSLETEVRNLKSLITDKLMEKEGLNP